MLKVLLATNRSVKHQFLQIISNFKNFSKNKFFSKSIFFGFFQGWTPPSTTSDIISCLIPQISDIDGMFKGLRESQDGLKTELQSDLEKHTIGMVRLLYTPIKHSTAVLSSLHIEHCTSPLSSVPSSSGGVKDL